MNKILGQDGNIVFAFAQGWHFDWKNVQPVKQVAAKHTGTDRLLKVAICRCDQAHVCFDGLRSTDSLELVFLQHTQQRNLCFRGDFAHFIKKQGATPSQLEATKFPLQCACEGAFFMAEQF